MKPGPLLVVSVILPADSPRFELRLNPLLDGFEIEKICFRGMDVRRICRRLVSIRRMVSKGASSDLSIYCLDPAALLLVNIAMSFGGGKCYLLYDRNERWPFNWRRRKNVFQRIASFIPDLFIAAEKLLCRKVCKTTTTDYTTGKVVDENCIVIPNRIYRSYARKNSLYSKFSNQFLYHGSLGGVRDLGGVLSLFDFSGPERLTIYSRKQLDVEDGQYSVRNKGFEVDALKDEGDKYLCGIVVVNPSPYLDRLIPSKIAFYWNVGLPVLAFGDTRALKLLSHLLLPIVWPP